MGIGIAKHFESCEMIHKTPAHPINKRLADMENVSVAVNEQRRFVVIRHLAGNRLEKVIEALGGVPLKKEG